MAAKLLDEGEAPWRLYLLIRLHKFLFIFLSHKVAPCVGIMGRQWSVFFVLSCSLLVVLSQQPFGSLSGNQWQQLPKTEKLYQMINLQYDNVDTASFPQPPNDADLLSYEYIVKPIFETPSGSYD